MPSTTSASWTRADSRQKPGQPANKKPRIELPSILIAPAVGCVFTGACFVEAESAHAVR